MEIAPNGVFSVVPPVGGGVLPPRRGGSGRGLDGGGVALALGVEPPPQPLPAGEGLLCSKFATVPVRPRDDGWSAERQRAFLECLAATGSVTVAARSVGMSRESAYALRRRADARGFAQAWDAARALAVEHLTEVAWDRALHGEVRPIFYHGELVGETRHYDNRLLLALIAQNRVAAGAAIASPALVAEVAADWDAALVRAERGEALSEPVPEPVLEPESAPEPVSVAAADALGADHAPFGEPLIGTCERDGSFQSEAQMLCVGFYDHWWDEAGARWLTDWPLPEVLPEGEAWDGEEFWVDDNRAVLGPYDEDMPAPEVLGRPIDRHYARTLSAAEAEGLETAEARAAAHRAMRLELYRRQAFGLATPAERAAIAAGNGE
jgi:hypothetical protein